MHDACRLMQLWGDFQLRGGAVGGDVGVDQAELVIERRGEFEHVSVSTPACAPAGYVPAKGTGPTPVDVGPVLAMDRGYLQPSGTPARSGSFR